MEINSLLSPKRPRIDVTMTKKHSFEWRSDVPEFLTLQQTTSSSPSINDNLQKNVLLTYSACSGHVQDEKPQHTAFISHTDCAHTGMKTVFFITAERHLLNLQKDEQPSLTESDKLSSAPRDNAGGALTESHTSKDTSADMSSRPDCERLGKSLEDELPGGNCLPTGDDKDGRQVQNNASQIQVFTLSASDEFSYQNAGTYENVLHDEGDYHTGSQTAKLKASNQKKNRLKFCENILLCQEESGTYQTYPSDYVDFKSFHSNPEEESPGNLANGLKNVGENIELQFCKNENAAVGEEDTEGLINDGMGKNSIPSVAECAEGSIVFHNVVLARNITEENVSALGDDFFEAKEEHATGEMTATAGREVPEHTTETTLPPNISEEPTEGDNEPGCFSVIHPAVQSETNRESEEKCCSSVRSASVERSPSVIVCEMKSSEVSVDDQNKQLNHQNTEEEKEDLCKPDTEPHVCSTPINETHNMTGSESSRHWNATHSRSPHRPCNHPHIKNGQHEVHKLKKHHLKEQNESDCVPVCLDHMKTQQLESSQAAIARIEKANDIKENKDMISFGEQIKPEEYQNLEKTVESGDACVQQNEKHKINANETSSAVYISVWTEGEIIECDNRFTLIEDEETTAAKEREEVINWRQEIKIHGIENSKTEDLLQREQRTDTTKLTHIECIGEFTGENPTKSGNTLSQVCQHKQENKPAFSPDKLSTAETLMATNKDDLSILAFAPASDAFVPCKHDLSHSQNANNHPTALNCNDRFSPVPSVFTFCDRMPKGFDTFEKIPLSPDDADASLCNSPLLTSLPRQLLKTSVQQLFLSMPGAESDKHEEIPGEETRGKEKVARFEHHNDSMAHDLLSSDSTADELPNFISDAEIIALRWLEQQRNSDSTCEHIQDEIKQSTSSSVSTERDSPSDVNMSADFEMKKQFDMVLKELILFFDISVNDFSRNSKELTPEQCGDAAGALESDVSCCKKHLSSPEVGCHRDSTDDADEDFGGDPVISYVSGGCEGEQEVPLGHQACQRTSVKAAEKQREPQDIKQRRKTWSPSFTYPLSFEQLSHRAPEQLRRLQPLRTCTRPIRVGLSKRAKTKRLHRPRPYV